MRNRTKLLFGIHMHQPIDNFDWVIEKGVEVCYGPFFDVMSRYPEFKFSVHCSGWLMEQIKAHHPKLYGQIVSLAEQGSIEFFSAGYYEPILSVIPSEDRLTQIRQLSDAISTEFAQEPEGLWLTERVWESTLIPDLKRSGINFTVMDDYHFQATGFDQATLDGYYMTEEGGVPMGLFPISQKLRYAIPFLTVDGALRAIKAFDREANSAAIIFDDAEKFGMWPGTYEWVYEKGWLENFVQAVLADEAIETMHYGDYFKQERTRGVAYLPNVSYYEMGEWSLRADDALKLNAFKSEMGHERFETEGVKFLKGGIWKNFFVKYTESNRMHKRVQELSHARQEVNDPAFAKALYKAQTNDALWHGVFGGLYLANLRDNTYRYIIEAENVRYSNQMTLSTDQNELDGYDKLKAVTADLICRFDAGCGGQLVELDSRHACFNWQNTLTRRKEAYHEAILQGHLTEEPEPHCSEEGIDTIHHAQIEVDDALRDEIIYDWYLKNSFIDHLSDTSFNAGSFKHCNFREYGDFSNQPFEMTLSEQSVTFSREGGLYLPEKFPAHMEKRYTMHETGFDFEIEFSTWLEQPLQYLLEHNFHFADYEQVVINGEPLGEEGHFTGVESLTLVDRELKQQITIRLDQACDLYYFRLATLSQTEEGFDLSVQGVSIAMAIPFANALSLKGRLEVTHV